MLSVTVLSGEGVTGAPGLAVGALIWEVGGPPLPCAAVTCRYGERKSLVLFCGLGSTWAVSPTYRVMQWDVGLEFCRA